MRYTNWILAIVLACTATVAAKAQQWCPPGAKWIYDTGNPWVVSRTELTYSGDTMVDGYISNRINRLSLITSINGNDTMISEPDEPFFTRANDDVVWEWNGSNWDTLYWFSAHPGDQWQPFWPFGVDCPEHTWRVVDTSTVNIGGWLLRRLEMILDYGGTSIGQPFMITERIGGAGGWGFPGVPPPPCDGIHECFCSYLCYQDQDISHPNEVFCSISVGVAPYTGIHSSNILVYPHPIAGLAYIEWNKERDVTRIDVIDNLGRLAFISNFLEDNNVISIDFHNLSPGMYTLRLINSFGEVSATPIIVQ